MSEPRHISECIGEWLEEYAATIRTPRDTADMIAEYASTPALTTEDV